jgi:4-hydroxy-4-methyl-2-oxoglutarate aldolase
MVPELDLTQAATLSTAAVSDALDRLEIPGQCRGIMPVDRSFRVVGRAVTLRYAPVGVDHGTVGDYIDDLGPGQVVVIDNGGRFDVTVWGDLLTTTASRRGVQGTVIDGICRDVARSLELRYPIFSCGHWMRTGKDRVRLEAVDVAVSVGGVRVEPGDLMVGDADGLVSIPQRRCGEVLEAAVEIEAAERRIREAVEAGVDLKEARAAVRYHSLQNATEARKGD